MTRLDELADTPIGEGPGNTIGTLMYAAATTVMFVLEPETWPVYLEWYSRKFGDRELRDNQETARRELVSMLRAMMAIEEAGRT